MLSHSSFTCPLISSWFEYSTVATCGQLKSIPSHFSFVIALFPAIHPNAFRRHSRGDRRARCKHKVPLGSEPRIKTRKGNQVLYGIGIEVLSQPGFITNERDDLGCNQSRHVDHRVLHIVSQRANV